MRRRKAEKQQLIPDIRYNSELVTSLINIVMKRGKKSVAQSVVYKAFNVVEQKEKGADPLEVFLQALENVRPRVQVKARRIGGATYQVPVEVDPEQQVAVGLRWLCQYAAARKGASMAEALASEVIDAYHETGSAVKKREDTHKMAAANRAFAHFR